MKPIKLIYSMKIFKQNASINDITKGLSQLMTNVHISTVSIVIGLIACKLQKSELNLTYCPIEQMHVLNKVFSQSTILFG